MKKLLTGAALLWAGPAMLLGQQGGTSARQQTTATAPAAQSAAPARAASTASQAPAAGQVPSAAAEAAKQRAWLNKYCVGCHNNRTKNPSEDPVNLESASVDDLLPSAATWERVLRKMAVRAMPPQGTPHPAEGDYVGFTSWLSTSLDRAWEGKSNPGRYVVHRLNRTEYGNAIRDLLGLDVNVTDG